MNTPRPVPAWRDRWTRTTGGDVVLDLGLQPPSDLFPEPGDPLPDASYPLRMVMGAHSRLLQLEEDPTSPEEPAGVEPAALIRQADRCVADAGAAGLLPPGATFLCFPSPHGGSWDTQLRERGLVPCEDTRADVLVDVMGMMHEPDQRAALTRRAERLARDGVLLMMFHDATSILQHGMWNALRHGHFAYYSAPALVGMAEAIGLEAVGAWEYPLYNGTTLLAFAHKGSRWGWPPPAVTDLLERELAQGVLDPARARRLGVAYTESIGAIRAYVDDARRRGLIVAGYGAASRAAALLNSAGVTTDDVLMIADAAPAKHGRCMPATRIPIVPPAELVAAHPDRVLLFVADLLPEVRAALPQIEASGARWVTLDPLPVTIEPLTPELRA